MKIFIILSILLNVRSKMLNSEDTLIMSYFRKVDHNGNFIHREHPEYDPFLQKRIVMNIHDSDASSAVLKVTPFKVENGGNVTVFWSGVENPTKNDFIAFFCPTDDKPTHYLDHFSVTVDKNWSQGNGQHMVVVYNMRTTCDFKYFRKTTEAQLVAISNILNFTNGLKAPLQGHLALTNDPTQMRVMWVTGEVDKNVVVKYGKSKSLGLSETRHNVSTYSAESMCESPANSTGYWHPGYIYDVLLIKLEPNTKYFYSFGTGGVMSPIYTFMTALPAGDPTPYKWIAYGDMGIDPRPQGKSTAQNVMRDIESDDNYRMIFHNGDISYGLGYTYIWDQWFALIEPYATRVPYMIGIGNHEYDHQGGGEHDPSGASGQGFRPAWGNMGDDSNGECGVPMYYRFNMPEDGFKLWWYSYDYGLVHYVMMSTEHDFTPGSRQYEWLQKDLQHVDRKKTPWIIIGGHRAMYTSALMPDDYVVSINMQRLMEDLLHEYKVDLALWAHYHSYERTCRVYKQDCREDGTVHIVVGTAGRSKDPDIWFRKPWSEFHINDYGYGRISVINGTALYWEWVQNSSGKVLDKTFIVKP